MDSKCKKLGNRATKAERYEAHRAKMEMKAARELLVHGPIPASQASNPISYDENSS